VDIYLIRHADPDYANDSITELGVQQANKLGAYLNDVPLTHIYSSPMGRARKTMEPTLENRNIEPVILPWLHELEGNYIDNLWTWNVSLHELHTQPSLEKTIEDFMDQQRRQLVKSWTEFMHEHGYRRNGSGYQETREVAPGKCIAMFAHAGLILTLLSGIYEWPLVKTYTGVTYNPTAITHLRMLPVDEIHQLRIESMAARPHLGVESLFNIPSKR
jgi:broad specificity phosphatase PhoE